MTTGASVDVFSFILILSHLGQEGESTGDGGLGDRGDELRGLVSIPRVDEAEAARDASERAPRKKGRQARAEADGGSN